MHLIVETAGFACGDWQLRGVHRSSRVSVLLVRVLRVASLLASPSMALALIAITLPALLTSRFGYPAARLERHGFLRPATSSLVTRFEKASFDIQISRSNDDHITFEDLDGAVALAAYASGQQEECSFTSTQSLPLSMDLVLVLTQLFGFGSFQQVDIHTGRFFRFWTG